MTKCAEIELKGNITPISENPHEGYKETKAMWLSAEVMVLSNNDIPISEDISAALDLIQEIVRRARVDRWVEEYAELMRRKNMTVTKNTEIAVIRKAV